MAIYTQPEDLERIFKFEQLRSLAGLPDAESSADEDFVELIREQALHVAAEIDTALAHRFENLPSQPGAFIQRTKLSGSVTLSQWIDYGLGAGTDFAGELRPGDGITDGYGNWAQIREIPEPSPGSSDDSGDPVETIILENGWPGPDHEGDVYRGEVHPTLAWISSYLVLESMFERNPASRGRGDYKDKIGQARGLLEAIKNGEVTLGGVESRHPIRSDALTADGEVVAFETDMLYGYGTRNIP